MGSASRIVFFGAVSLIVGIYASSLKSVQAIDLDSSMMPGKRVQFERKATAAVRIAMNDWVSMYNYYGGFDYPDPTQPPLSATALGGGTFTYRFNYHYNYGPGTDYADVSISLPMYKDSARVVKARLQNTGGSGGMLQGPQKMRRGTWQVTKYFVQRGW